MTEPLPRAKKSNPVVVLGSIALIVAAIAGIGWYLQEQDAKNAGSTTASSSLAPVTSPSSAAPPPASSAAQYPVPPADTGAAGTPSVVPGEQRATPDTQNAMPAVAANPPSTAPDTAPMVDEKPQPVHPATKKKPAQKAIPQSLSPPLAASSRSREEPMAARNDSAPPLEAAPKPADRAASCKRLSNPFEREACMWKQCGNHWGKDGCPAYQQPLPGGGGS